MKAIKIHKDNATAIEAALAAVNGRATAHAYTSAAEIIAIASAAEQRMETLGISKKDRTGARAHAVSGDRVPNAYKYSRQGTRATIERKSATWHLTHVAQCTLYEDGGLAVLELTPAQDAAAVCKLRSSYTVQKPAA